MAAKKTTASTSTPKRPRLSMAATTPKKPAKPRTRRQPTVAVTAEEIRERAYFLSLERAPGAADPDADWARAERELTGSSKI